MNIRTRLLPPLAALLIAAAPARAANKDIVQLQTMVQGLQDQLQRLQQSIDERMGVMKNLVEQSTDNVNKMGVALSNLQGALDKQLQQQQQNTGTRVDQLSTQIQALNDSVDELKARLSRVSKQLEDMASNGQNLPAVSQTPATGPTSSPPQPVQAPPPDVLYNNALRDYNVGKFDLAAQGFSQFMKYYPTTDLAGNAQFYLADIEYHQGNYEAAVRDYDKVLEQYPGGNKTAAAQLKKGFALLELGQRQAGMRELNNLIARYPRSIEAEQARDRLHRLSSSVAPTRRSSPR